jgi:XTP/dITP diphosphohydrolase
MFVVLASSNPGKLAELRQLLPESIDVKSADDMGIELPEETGTTFEENAFLKAQTVSVATAQIAVADDSGLEVDALGGAPGVWSARYAGEPSDDQKNNDLLLRRLAGVDPAVRTARFRSVVAVVAPNGEMFSSAGVIEGQILETPRGSAGFGYDPLFMPLGLTKTMAELSLEQKNVISHRALAYRGVVENLLRLLETYQPWDLAGNNSPEHTSR